MVYFQTVANLGSFRKSAEVLRTSPATVSRRISELEALLDVQLFVRTTRNVYLTAIGEQLLSDTQTPVRQLVAAANQAANARDELAGLVRIATTHTICETHILPILPALYEAHPEIRVEISLNEKVVDIRDQNIDFALRAGRIKDPTLIARKICTDCIAVYSRTGTENKPYIEYAQDVMTFGTPQIQVQDMRIIHSMVRKGFGTAWLPVSLCAQDEKDGLLRRHTDIDPIEFVFHIVFHANRYIPQRTRIVMDAIADFGAASHKQASPALAGLVRY